MQVHMSVCVCICVCVCECMHANAHVCSRVNFFSLYVPYKFFGVENNHLFVLIETVKGYVFRNTVFKIQFSFYKSCSITNRKQTGRNCTWNQHFCHSTEILHFCTIFHVIWQTLATESDFHHWHLFKIKLNMHRYEIIMTLWDNSMYSYLFCAYIDLRIKRRRKKETGTTPTKTATVQSPVSYTHLTLPTRRTV